MFRNEYGDFGVRVGKEGRETWTGITASLGGLPKHLVGQFGLDSEVHGIHFYKNNLSWEFEVSASNDLIHSTYTCDRSTAQSK